MVKKEKKEKWGKTSEVCPYCDQQVEIDDTGISKCPNCEKWISPCSMCNMNEVDCDNCMSRIIAEQRNGGKPNGK